MQYYAGIGSRSTPSNVLKVMRVIAARMARNEWVLRSGAAYGADRAFEAGVDSTEYCCHKQIFTANDTIPIWAFDTVDQFHPAPHRLGAFARRLMARNALQVLGPHGDEPSQLVICWTQNGRWTGGTSQALRIAHHHGIPIHNLGLHRTYQHYASCLVDG